MQNEFGKIRGLRQSVDGSHRRWIASYRFLFMARSAPGKTDEQHHHSDYGVLRFLRLLGKLYHQTHAVR